MDYEKINELNKKIKKKRDKLKGKTGLEREKLLLQIRLDELEIRIERMKRKRILERFDEFIKNKITDEETNVKDDEVIDEVDDAGVKDDKENTNRKIKTKELSDKEMNDENVGEIVEEIKQYLKKIDAQYGR